MFIGYYQNKIKFYTEHIIDEPAIEKWKETQEEYILDGDEYVLNDDEYKERQRQKERERLNKLNVTRGDVFEALIRARGIEQPYIEQLIAVLPVPELDKKYINQDWLML